MLRKLIELLPISRRKYMENIQKMTIVLQGLVEAEANHCQIETNIIQVLQTQTQKNKPQKAKNTKNGSDPAFQ